MGNVTIAEQMFRHDPRAMLYAPLRTVIWEDGHEHGRSRSTSRARSSEASESPLSQQSGSSSTESSRRSWKHCASRCRWRCSPRRQLSDQRARISRMTQENGGAGESGSYSIEPVPPRKDEHVHADETEHRVRPRALGRRLVLQQGDPHASGGGVPGDVCPEQPRHARRRRRRRQADAGAGQQPGHPRRPLLRRNRHHRRGHRRSRSRAGLHRRTRPGRRRDVAEPCRTSSPHRRLRPHRDRGRAHLAAARTASGASRGTCPSRSSSSSGRPRACRPQTCSTRRFEGAAWKSKPSWYIVAKNDRTVHPELERFVAKRMGATIYEVDSSHVPMLSTPTSYST